MKLPIKIQQFACRLSQFVFSILLLSTFYLLPSVVHANTATDIPNTPHYSTQSTIIEIMSALTCQLSGIDPINPKQSCLGIDQTTGKIGFIPQEKAKAGGAIGVMGNLISMLYTPPLRTGDYFQNLASNFGIGKKVYAQTTGSGFEGLRPLMGLWTAFRNIVYLVFVIVFVVIGVAIMLRVKIDPRTVMTIQNQIPKIIVGILLVTFSYAIAGFLIDMMYTSIYLVGNIITSSDSKMDVSITNKVATAPNPFAAANRSVGLGVAFKSSTAIGGELKDMLDTPGGRVLTSIVGGVAGSLIVSAIPTNANGGIIGGLSKGKNFIGDITGKIAAKGTEIGATIGTFVIPGAGTAAGGLIGNIISNAILPFAAGAVTGALFGPAIIAGIATLVVFLILFIAMLVALFRLWFTLLMAYIQILLDVVFAPFWIIGGIIPGSPISITGWLKDIGANLLAFPVVIAMFLLGKVFRDAIGCSSDLTGATLEACKASLSNHFVPPLIGDRISAEAINGFISLGIVLITPNILNIIKAAIKAPKTDLGIGKTIGTGVGLATSTMKGAVGLKQASEEYIIKGYDEKTQKIDYGQRGIARGIFGRFGK